MKIIYCTEVYYLDNALEQVKLLAGAGHEVHLLVELSPKQLKANILHIEAQLEEYPPLIPFASVEKQWGLEYLVEFASQLGSFHFCCYPSKKVLPTLKVGKAIKKFIRAIRPDFIHLDDFSSRQLFLLPFFYGRKKKLVLNVHDPEVHSGEFRLLPYMYRFALYRMISTFVVFSEHSKTSLQRQLGRNKKVVDIKLLPYTVYRSFSRNSEMGAGEHIGFFGRISPYKGVEIFVDAIAIVHRERPDVQFHIGGKTIANYQPDFLGLDLPNVTIENKFLTNAEIVDIIQKSKLIVCPYLDATQSGVIMTAYAMNCPVLVSNVGGLPEYVDHGKTGMVLEENSPEALAKTLLQLVEDKECEQWSANLSQGAYYRSLYQYNLKGMDLIYQTTGHINDLKKTKRRSAMGPPKPVGQTRRDDL
ncbi:glycosyltransferase family 4 protein [Maribacter sp. 2307ULW6-5]|uniref:glycosyltransferase family 4 protein n=1 Tax=Maribacter sp. 2307ULW6-5 TaxID=3386275 RepID=UPI0039BD485E